MTDADSQNTLFEQDHSDSSTVPAFKDSDFWLDIENISIGPEIGKGKFSIVYIGKYFGDLVAVKKQTRIEVTLDEYLWRELSILKVCDHENLVSYIGAYNEEHSDIVGHRALYIVTELCHGGDLLKALLNNDLLMDWKLRVRIAKQAASAIDFLHKKNIIHRDIKSSNILLDDSWNCKISDFGMARESPSNGQQRRMTLCGTNEYMAPEILFEEDYYFGVDIFCFGMVLFEMIFRKQAGVGDFLTRKPQNMFAIDTDELHSQLPERAPESLFSLAVQCSGYDQSLRPSSEETLDWLLDLFDTLPEDQPVPPVNDFQSIFGVSQENAHNHHQMPNKLQLSSPLTVHQRKPSITLGSEMKWTPLNASKRKDNEASTPTNISHHLNQDQSSNTPEVQSYSTNELYRRFHLFESNEFQANSNLFLSDSLSTSQYNKQDLYVIRSGYLYKRNDSGFRNWKKIYCTLTETKFIWKSSSDKSKRCYFNLKDTVLKRTVYNRWMLVEQVDSTEQDFDTMLGLKGSHRQNLFKDFNSTSNYSIIPTGNNAPSTNHISSSPIPFLYNSNNTTNNNNGNDSLSVSIFQKEFAAKSSNDMEDWIKAIQEVIDDLTDERRASELSFSYSMPSIIGQYSTTDAVSTLAVVPMSTKLKGIEEFHSVGEWMKELGIPSEFVLEYERIFISKGYGNTETIAKVGLNEKDLEYLGISNPLHGRLLLSTIKPYFSDSVKIGVTNWSKLHNSGVTVYKVVSRWQYSRSSTFIKYSNFKKFDRILRQDLKRIGFSLSESIPQLPPGKILGCVTHNGELAAFISHALRFPNDFVALIDSYDT
eukprot:gene7775-10562_t